MPVRKKRTLVELRKKSASKGLTIRAPAATAVRWIVSLILGGFAAAFLSTGRAVFTTLLPGTACLWAGPLLMVAVAAVDIVAVVGTIDAADSIFDGFVLEGLVVTAAPLSTKRKKAL